MAQQTDTNAVAPTHATVTKPDTTHTFQDTAKCWCMILLNFVASTADATRADGDRNTAAHLSITAPTFTIPQSSTLFKYCISQIQVRAHGLVLVTAYVELTEAVSRQQVSTLFHTANVHVLYPNRRRRWDARKDCMQSGPSFVACKEVGTWDYPDGLSTQRECYIHMAAIKKTLWKYKTWEDVVVSNRKEIMYWLGAQPYHLKALYDQRPSPTVSSTPFVPQPWQDKALQYLRTCPLGCKILWLWSAEACTAKTELLHYAATLYSVHKMPTATTIREVLEQCEGEEVLWWDRPLRGPESAHKQLYATLHQLQGRVLHLVGQPVHTHKVVVAHLVVTSHVPPDYTQLTAERVYEVHTV